MSPPRRTQREEWQEHCRNAILDAAVRLLTREGSTALTMERLAAEAGVAKGTLYLYFTDKKTLLEALRGHSLGPLWKELFALLDSDRTPVERLGDFVERHLVYFDQNRDFLRVLLWERQIQESHLKRHRSDIYRTCVEKLASVIREGIQAGALREVDAEKVAAMLMEADIGINTQRLWSGTAASVKADARLLVDVFLRGIARGPAQREAHP